MRNLLTVKDVGDINYLLRQAKYIKAHKYDDGALGKNKTILLLFFNPSLRTRLSTQKAAVNLGMNCIVTDINRDGWRLERRRGVVMDGECAEHILEAIPVMCSYCDIIGIRSFAGLKDKEYDYSETLLKQFMELGTKPVLSLESATRHPMQAFADIITIEEYKRTHRPKVVLSWAPHPNALPQAVPNSFAEWAVAAGYEVVITHPPGYELDPSVTQGAYIEYDQEKAFRGADFIYAKNWSAYSDENYGKVLSTDRSYTIDKRKMSLTNSAYFMHCLPVRRNMIVTDEVIESHSSLVIPQAANREIAAQTLIKEVLREISNEET